MGATFVLIPGAGGAGVVYWRATAAELVARGHRAVPVDFPGDDPAAGLAEYAACTDEAIGDHRGVVLVAQSMGGFTVPMITTRASLTSVVLVNAMIPVPGETPGEWFVNTGADAARRVANEAAGRSDDLDPDSVFFHDVPHRRKADMIAGDREPVDTAFGQPCTFGSWPDAPIHVLVGADDRLFPAEFQRRIAFERLGVKADVMPGGHLVALSRPVDLAQRLVDYLATDTGR